MTSHKEYLHERLAGMRPRRVRRDRAPFRQPVAVAVMLLAVCVGAATLIGISGLLGGGW